MRSLAAWWHMPAILAFRKWRQEHLKFKTSLGYTAGPCLNKKQKTQKINVMQIQQKSVIIELVDWLVGIT
jgi:hypothetical protein